MIIATDIDGVLSHPMGLKCLDWLLRHRKLSHWLMDFPIPIGKVLYRMRRVDKKMKALLVKMANAGHTIVIVSFVPIHHTKEVLRWLELNKIPFNELLLPLVGEEEIAFRARAIPESCDFYFDDDHNVVKQLSLLVPATRIIMFQGADLPNDLL